MTATYWVQVSDELVRDMDPSLLPEGLRLAGRRRTLHTGGRLEVLIEDDNAPDELNGKRVELILGLEGRMPAKAVIIERRVIA